MEVILLERIEKLGQMGDVVKVKPGFARNYLLPQQKALRATKENMAVFESRRTQLEADNLKRRDEAQSVADKIDGMTLTVIRQAGDSGQLYGSVTSRDLAEAMTAGGATIARSQISLDRPIKMLGLHPVRIRLHPEVAVTVTANVARSEAEAERQIESGRFVTTEEQEEAEDAAESDVVAETAPEETAAEDATAEDAAAADATTEEEPQAG